MSFARVYSAQPYLLNGHIVTVEVDIFRNSLHNFSIVGLPAKAVDEAKFRVGSAIKNAGLPSPKSKNQKTVVSLSPADLKKEGSYFDLAIAISYLLADELISFNPEKKIFLGELSLNGELQPVKGVLALVREAKNKGYEEIFLPFENRHEASLIRDIKIFGCKNLKEVIDHLTGINLLVAEPKQEFIEEQSNDGFDFSDIRGQETAKRGLAIAAAGGHNVLMIGPPGTGKTLLARAFANILPSLGEDELLEVTSIHSIAGNLKNNLATKPPFRAPHHSASAISLIGGGAIPKPGEVTLAHRGVLFLDEFPEFSKDVIENLREPLEEKRITVSRASGRATFPASFILIAAMNPCPCGFFGSQKECRCLPTELIRYQKKISGPILDRIDLVVSVENFDYEKLSDEKKPEDANLLKDKIKNARTFSQERLEKFGFNNLKTNSEMGLKEIEKIIVLPKDLQNLLNDGAKKLDLSARSYHRVMKLARTIADLEGKENIEAPHLLEALQYRPQTGSGFFY